ncbi:hypothetical protein AB1P65_13405 [Roseibium alexandrii]
MPLTDITPHEASGPQDLSDLPAVRELREISGRLPAHFSPQHEIEWLSRPVPGYNGKTPTDMVFEGRAAELNRHIEDLHKTFWQRMRDKLFS